MATTSEDIDELDLRRRRIIWRAGHRSMRELDLVLGTFAREHLADMDATALAQFESILEVSDTDLFDWIMGKAGVPAQYQGPLIETLRGYRFRPDDYHGQ